MHRALAFMPAQTTDQHVLAVYFDKSGKVERVANYGMQDGKVFDYVSRTTPTGGQEPTSSQHHGRPDEVELTGRAGPRPVAAALKTPHVA